MPARGRTRGGGGGEAKGATRPCPPFPRDNAATGTRGKYWRQRRSRPQEVWRRRHWTCAQTNQRCNRKWEGKKARRGHNPAANHRKPSLPRRNTRRRRRRRTWVHLGGWMACVWLGGEGGRARHWHNGSLARGPPLRVPIPFRFTLLLCQPPPSKQFTERPPPPPPPPAQRHHHPCSPPLPSPACVSRTVSIHTP